MILNSAISEGLAGMQQSQKRLQQTAHDIVKAGLPTDSGRPSATALGGVPASNFGTNVNDLAAVATVGAGGASHDVSGRGNMTSDHDLIGSMLQQKQQQLLFDASANVVKAANDTLGSVIDEMS